MYESYEDCGLELEELFREFFVYERNREVEMFLLLVKVCFLLVRELCFVVCLLVKY